MNTTKPMKSFLLLSMLFLLACNTTPPKPAHTNESGPHMDMLSKEQMAFIRDWSDRYNPQNIPVLNIFRNRYFRKTDLTELHTYIQRNKEKEKIYFTTVEKELRYKTELGIDTEEIKTINWINNTDVETCDKVDPDFWGCFNLRYKTDKFYYLSMPLFSSDKQWCLLHVTLQHKVKGESFGGGRLYHLEKGKWEEKAFLSYWGKSPE
ncbi:MAG: hypothetical protein V4590_11780 [Bacteroidota bacterium]